MSTKTLTDKITSYDLLKTFAVIIMVVDHLGYYFFDDELWWRAVGRIGFPVWFFLVGHSTGRDLPTRLIVAACILQVVHSSVGLSFFPLNALFTIICIRLVMDPLMRFALQSRTRLWVLSIGLAVIAMPSYVLMEYGTLGLITAMFGYFVRHRQTINDDKLVISFMLFALLTFVFYQQVNFGFSLTQFTFMALGTAAVRYSLLNFKALGYPGLTARCPAALSMFFRLCGRRTLEIYVVHLVIFDAIGVIFDLSGMGLFRWRLGLPVPGF
jgi:hypothetical protein